MGAVTETHHRMQDQTVLYVPKEALTVPVDLASKDRDLCARLEGKNVNNLGCSCWNRLTHVKLDVCRRYGPLDPSNQGSFDASKY